MTNQMAYIINQSDMYKLGLINHLLFTRCKYVTPHSPKLHKPEMLWYSCDKPTIGAHLYYNMYRLPVCALERSAVLSVIILKPCQETIFQSQLYPVISC